MRFDPENTIYIEKIENLQHKGVEMLKSIHNDVQPWQTLRKRLSQRVGGEQRVQARKAQQISDATEHGYGNAYLGILLVGDLRSSSFALTRERKVTVPWPLVQLPSHLVTIPLVCRGGYRLSFFEIHTWQRSIAYATTLFLATPSP